ncbi:MAG: hypothetical protein ACJAYU_000533 [Bradymonadia bacterium]|jgi:hypothetical protein
MLAALTAALLSFSAAPSGHDSTPTELLLAINPNISIGTCTGATQIAVSNSMSERTVSGRFVGEMDGLTAFGNSCVGYYAEEAHFCMSVPEPGGYFMLEVMDAGGYDSTLAVVSDTLEWPACDDDGGTRGHSLLSRVNQWFPAGVYLIHVGAFSQGATAPFTLSLTTHDGSVW